MESIDADVAAVGRRASHRRRLVAAARSYCRFALSHPGPFALMFRFDLLDRDEVALAEASHGAFDRFCELVVAAQCEDWQPGDEPGALAGALWSAVHGLSTLWLDESIQPSTLARSPDDILDPLLSMLVPTRRQTR
jgi:hypothetical protein